MGFELFVHRYRHGASAPYDRRIAKDILDRDATLPYEHGTVEYADGRAEIYCGDEDCDGSFDGFMLAHFSGTTICERALEIADVTQSLIFWPSTHISFAVTSRATLKHLPADIKTDGMLVALVVTVDQLWVAINAEEGEGAGVEIVWPIARSPG